MTRSEFSQTLAFLKKQDCVHTAEQTGRSELVEAYDVNKDGKLTIHEFEEGIRKKDARVRNR